MIQSPRVRFAAFVLASIASLLPSCASGDAGMDRSDARPNILMILADDVGVGDLRLYNRDALVGLPAIERLARSGVTFSDAHATPLCAPSRYALLSGNSPARARRDSEMKIAFPASPGTRSSVSRICCSR